jgi:uncharacterized Zn finger protein
MSQVEIQDGGPQPRPVLSKCPECNGRLFVLRVIGGRAGREYWVMRCTRCGGIHLDILGGTSPLERSGIAAN